MHFLLSTLACTATIVLAAPAAVRNGTSLLKPVFVSVPFGGKGLNTSQTGLSITGNNAKDGTNYTLASPYTPAGGDQQTGLICECDHLIA